MGSDEDDDDEGTKSGRQEQKNWILALFLLLIYIGLVITSSQLTSSAFNDEKFKPYKAPFLFVWCKMFLRTLAFPCVFLIQTCIRVVKRRPVSARKIWQHSTKALRRRDGEGRLGVRVFLKKFFPMSITMLLLQLGWVIGHVHAPSSIVTALYSTTIAFSYILSWIVLKNKMLLIKGLFVLVAFTGTALISYASTIARYAVPDNSTRNATLDIFPDQLTGNSTDDAATSPLFSTTSFAGANVYVGVFCGISAAVFCSLNSLSFKMAFPKTDLIQVSLIMTFMSLFICLMYLPVPLTLNFIGWETWEFSKMPLHIMVTAWFFAFVSSVAYAYGLALSNPFFMSVGEVLIVAISTGIDTLVRKIEMNSLQIAGTSLVALAFIFMVMPDPWLSVNLRRGRRQSPVALSDDDRQSHHHSLLEISPESHRLNPKIIADKNDQVP